MHTLDNLPDQPHAVIQLTPRSSEALKRRGYTLGMLTKKSKEQINASYGDHIDNHDIVNKRYEHEEDKRVNRLKEGQLTRRLIIQEMEEKGLSGYQTAKGSTISCTMIQKEMKQL
jgi:hypothetical protein